MLPYEPDRACDSQQISDSDHPDHHQQSCSGHGAPVADALLWKTLFPDGSGGCSGLLQGSRRIGCAAIRVTAKEEVAPAIEKAIALQKPVVIDCRIPEDDKVFPMVPAGAAISEVFDGDDLTSK